MEREQSIVCVAGMDMNKRSGKWQGRMMRMSNQVKGRKKKQALPGFFPPWLKSENIHIFSLLRNKLKEFGTCPLLCRYLISSCTFSC